METSNWLGFYHWQHWSLSTSKTLLDHGSFPLKRHQVLCCEASPGHQAKGSGPFGRAGSNQALWDRPQALKIHRMASFQSMAHSTRFPPSNDPKALLSLHVLNKRKRCFETPCYGYLRVWQERVAQWCWITTYIYMTQDAQAPPMHPWSPPPVAWDGGMVLPVPRPVACGGGMLVCWYVAMLLCCYVCWYVCMYVCM